MKEQIENREQAVEVRVELIEENIQSKKNEAARYQKSINTAIQIGHYSEVADWAARLQAVASEIDALQIQLRELKSLVNYMKETIRILKSY